MQDVTNAFEDWPFPSPWGWTAEDMDRLPSAGPNGELDFFSRVELIDGALVFAAPQSRLHERIVRGLAIRLGDQAPGGTRVVCQMDVKLGHRSFLVGRWTRER